MYESLLETKILKKKKGLSILYVTFVTHFKKTKVNKYKMLSLFYFILKMFKKKT